MADVTIIPPPQVQTVAAPGGQTQQNTQATSPPAGTLVSGTIAGRDANGNYLLKSPQGTFTLQSGTPLTYNSDVTIRIAGNTSARIVTVNGEPFSQFSTPEPATSDSVAQTLLTQAPEASASTASTPTVRAVVVSAPPAQPQATPALSQGGNVLVRLTQQPAQQAVAQPQVQEATAPPETSPTLSGSATVAVQPEQVAQNTQPAIAAQPAQPQPQAAPATSAPATAASAPAVETQLAPDQAVTQTPQAQQPAATTGQSQQSTAQQTSPLQPQATTSNSAPASTLYNVYAKQAATPAVLAAPSSTPATIPAQVVSTQQDGTVALQTALGNVTIKPSASELSLFIAGATLTLTPSAPPQSGAPAPLTELASSWQTLKDILNEVNNGNPGTANTLLARLPQVGAQFVSTSTNFIAALLQGDARKLLGDDTVDTLRDNGRQDLIEKFSAEAASLGSSFTQPAAEKQTQGWQTLFLPFVYQETLQQARMYVKRDGGKKERAQAKAQDDTRFVVEVDLSELGPMQMDGLVRKKEQATAFDLVIRTHHLLSSDDQKEITEIYASAAQMTGFKGSLAFQVTRDFPVKPLDEIAGEEAHVITA